MGQVAAGAEDAVGVAVRERLGEGRQGVGGRPGHGAVFLEGLGAELCLGGLAVVRERGKRRRLGRDGVDVEEVLGAFGLVLGRLLGLQLGDPHVGVDGGDLEALERIAREEAPQRLRQALDGLAGDQLMRRSRPRPAPGCRGHRHSRTPPNRG